MEKEEFWHFLTLLFDILYLLFFIGTYYFALMAVGMYGMDHTSDKDKNLRTNKTILAAYTGAIICFFVSLLLPIPFYFYFKILYKLVITILFFFVGYGVRNSHEKFWDIARIIFYGYSVTLAFQIIELCVTNIVV